MQRKTFRIYNESESSWEINTHGRVFLFSYSLKLKNHGLGRWAQSGKYSLGKCEDQGSKPSTDEKDLSVVVDTCYPRAEKVTQKDPWGLVVSHSRGICELQIQ